MNLSRFHRMSDPRRLDTFHGRPPVPTDRGIDHNHNKVNGCLRSVQPWLLVEMLQAQMV